jgi:hypothetical protein
MRGEVVHLASAARSEKERVIPSDFDMGSLEESVDLRRRRVKFDRALLFQNELDARLRRSLSR